MQGSMVGFSTGQTVAYLDCGLEGCSLPWYSITDIHLRKILNKLPEGMLYDTLSPDPLQKVEM